MTGDVISDVSRLSTKLIQISRGRVSLQNNQQRPKIMTHLPVNYPAISMEVSRRTVLVRKRHEIYVLFE